MPRQYRGSRADRAWFPSVPRGSLRVPHVGKGVCDSKSVAAAGFPLCARGGTHFGRRPGLVHRLDEKNKKAGGGAPENEFQTQAAGLGGTGDEKAT